ncbi:TlpA disulfide reductase family protein [Rivibacter subsaxonicus]|uniref:Peroxiredoxin n=1 Tax=Rivibacter subsaxonicus TaxID=457575 RepID=A0A4Q7VV97_9BURK|nr:TlpA disulfide reductase family protein [Rivibacter subsaxonicus]RZU00550.1 peroxiredoxin [Rivibacter subsaxonicus]
MTSSKRNVAAIVAVLFVIGAVAALWALSPKATVPDVPYTLLDGSTQRTTDLRGKVVLVNFWATSCVTCVKEMPELIATHRKFNARGFETLAVAMSYDPPAYVVNFAQSRGLPFKVAIDNTGEIARRFGDVQLTPTTLLVNRRGEVVKRFVGEPDFAELHATIDRLLDES